MTTSLETIAGREHELVAIGSFFDELSDGAGALVLQGEAGIGKTTIWHAALELAGQRSIRVLRARPAQSERRLSYAALTDALESTWDEVRNLLPEPQRAAMEAALLRAETETPADIRTTATAFVSVLRLLAEEHPVVVAVDDVQWLDPASEHVLEFAARRLPMRAGILVALRTSSGHDDRLPLELDRLAPPTRAEQMHVGPLSVAALHHAIRRSLGAAPPRPLLIRIADASGGNPFLAIELARASRERGTLTVSPTLRDLVEERIGTLSPEARSIVLIAAALSRPTISLVREGADVPDADAAIAEATAAGILSIEGDGRIRFAHPLLASALADPADDETLRRLHLRLAAVVDDPEERARHLAAGTTRPDEAVAKEIEQGAALAARRAAPVAAAELYDLACRLTPPSASPEVVVRRLLGHADALAAAGDNARGQAVAEAAVEAAPAGRLRAVALVGVYRAALQASTPSEAIAALERAMVELGDEDPALRRDALGRLARHTGLVDPRRALRYSEVALQELTEECDSAGLGRVTIGTFLARVVTGQGADLELLARGVRLEEGAGGPEDGVVLPWYIWTDDHEAARERWEAQTAIAIARGNERDRAERLAIYARSRFQLGDWDEAERMLDEACAVLEQSGATGPSTLAFAARSLLDAHRGRFERARETLHRLLDGSEATWWRMHQVSVLAAVEFAAGDLGAAERAWSRMDAEFAATGIEEAPWDRSEPDRVDARLVAGNVEGARTAFERLEWRGRTLPRLWIDVTLPRARALLIAADGDVAGALAALHELDEDRASRLPLELGRALLLRGSLERRSKQRGAARATLGRAREIFAGLGASPWVERTDAELRRTGLRTADGDELTETERRIAELAASGLTNREVAQAAFVSPKTVEANLARVYRKLGISSRAELGARMTARP